MKTYNKKMIKGDLRPNFMRINLKKEFRLKRDVLPPNI